MSTHFEIINSLTPRGISFILSSIVFHVIPTALEITMVCSILVRG